MNGMEIGVGRGFAQVLLGQELAAGRTAIFARKSWSYDQGVKLGGVRGQLREIAMILGGLRLNPQGADFGGLHRICHRNRSRYPCRRLPEAS
jgi:hypothetical protein